jgi:hypothetical protein
MITIAMRPAPMVTIERIASVSLPPGHELPLARARPRSAFPLGPDKAAPIVVAGVSMPDGLDASVGHRGEAGRAAGG